MQGSSKVGSLAETSYYDELEPGDLIMNMKNKAIRSITSTISTEISSNLFYLNVVDCLSHLDPIPEFTVKPIPPDMTPGFRLVIGSTERSSGSSLKSTRFSSKMPKSSRFPINWAHDFTFLTLESKSDRPLKDYFPEMNDEDDKLTPDTIIRVSNNCIIVMEYTTRDSRSHKSLRIACQEKYNKYLSALNSRKDEMVRRGERISIYFGVIAVSPYSVCSNFVVPRELAEDLCYRLKFAYSVEQELIPYGIQPRLDEEMSLIEKRCAIELSSISKEEYIEDQREEYPEYSREIYDSIWMSEVDTGLISEQISNLHESVKKELNEESEKRGALGTHESLFRILKQQNIKKIGSCIHVNGPDECNLQTCEILRGLREDKCIKSASELARESKIASLLVESQSILLDDFNKKKLCLRESQGELQTKIDKKALIQYPYLPLSSNITHQEGEMMDISEDIEDFGIEDGAYPRLWRKVICSKNFEESAGSYSGQDKCPYGESCCVACNPDCCDDDGASENGDDECEEFQDSINDGGINKGANDRTLYKRVQLTDLTIDDQIEFACQGVNGKRFADHIQKINKKQRSQLPYSPDVDTEDISKFINESWCDLFLASSEEEGTGSSATDLLEDAANLINSLENVKEVLDTQRKVQTTNLFRALKVISDMAMELNMSLKQHCKKDQYILKRLKDYKVYLLIKPTNSSGCLFYTVFWDSDEMLTNDIHEGIFKSPIKINDRYMCTEFCSTNKSKLSNQITTWAKLHAILAMYMNENKLDPLVSGGELPVFTTEECYYLKTGQKLGRNQKVPDLVTRLRKTCKMTLLMMMIMLHDKAEVEEHFTMIRYICMEGFVALPCLPNPAKMMSKFSVAVRSRFTMWVQKKLMEFIKGIILGGRYISEQESIIGSNRKKIVRTNLNNKFINEEIESEGELINMFYIGYGVNKNQVPNANVIGKLYAKILEWEDKFDESYIGEIGIKERPDSEDYRDHEYSPNWIKAIADSLLNVIKSTSGKDPKNFLESQFLRTYGGMTIMKTLGTLKASTTFNERTSAPGSSLPRRLKVIEAAKDLLESDKIYMFEAVKESLDTLYNEGGLYVDLFKKNQHGGLREIYILNIHSRVVQHCIETMSRSICQIFPSETMTNPSSKTKLFNAHKQRVFNRFQGVEVMTNCTSDDAKKWNQGHYASKFALLLCRLMPKRYHSLIRSICFLWHKKKIMIDGSLLRIFKKNPDLELNDKIIDEIGKIYMNRKQGTRWMEVGSRYIQTRTGMMQGILHYTSSLLHTAHNEFLKRHFSNFIQNFLEENNEKLDLTLNRDPTNPYRYMRPVITVMQSSDDSSVIISLPCINRERRLEMSYLTAFCFKFKAKSGRLSGIYPSEKSTLNTPGIMEFNSNWLFMNNRHNPYLKHVLSSVRVSGQSTLVGRQQELYNGVTEVIENGGSMMLAFICQYAIGLLHYQTMGLSVSHLFDHHYKGKLLKLKLPSLGYFLMDNIHLSGISGWDFLHWNLCKKTLVGDYLFLLFEANKRTEKLETDDENYKALIMDNCTAGLFSAVTNLRIGSNYKLQRLRESFNIPIDWLALLNENPLPIVSTPKNVEDRNLAIAAHLNSPNMQASFNDLDCTSSISAAAGYHLKFACYVVDSSVQIDSLTSQTREAILDQVSWVDVKEDKNEKLAEIVRERYKSMSKKSLMAVLMRAWELNNEIDDVKNEFQSEKFYEEEKNNFISNIFPKEGDYLTIADHTQTIPPLVLYKDDRELQNRLSTISVTSTDFEQFKAPYNLCLMKWFNIGKIDRRCLNYLWVNLTHRYPWIKDSYKKTLRSSPFTDCIQLFNFLSRLEKKDRKVKLLSIPITMNLHESDLSILINNNVWSGHGILKPEDKTEAKLLGDSLNMRNVAHTLYMVNAFPLNEDYKLKIMDKLLSGTIIKNTQVKSTRLMKLLTITKFSQGASNAEILSDVTDGAFGVVGVYTRRQYYDKEKKIYTGIGIWEGRLEGTNIKIIVKEVNGQTSLLKVILSRSLDIKTLIDFLKEWCEMNNVYNDHNFGDQKEYSLPSYSKTRMGRTFGLQSSIISSPTEVYSFGLTRFGVISIGSGVTPNCKVFLDNMYKSPMLDPTRGDLSLEFMNGILRLIFTEVIRPLSDPCRRIKKGSLSSFRESNYIRRYTLVSHRIQYRDFAQRFVNRQSFGALSETLTQSEGNIITHWLTNEVCPLSKLLDLLHRLVAIGKGEREHSSMPIDIEGFKALIKGNFDSWAMDNLNRAVYGGDIGLTEYFDEPEEADLEMHEVCSKLVIDDSELKSLIGDDIKKLIDDLGQDDEDEIIASIDMEGFNMEGLTFADFVTHKVDESQVIYNSPLFSSLFEFLFGSLKNEEDRRNLFEDCSLPIRLKDNKEVIEFVLNKQLRIVFNSLQEEGYSDLFPEIK